MMKRQSVSKKHVLAAATLPSVSIVIPAYNEENHLYDCLVAIARQTVRPYEVIVVDNNSTDKTVAIARSFPFVRVVSEMRQGVMYARDAGFNAARGEIVGRLDADSVIASNWVETVQKLFAADPQLCAATGTVQYREVCFPRLFNTADFAIRRFMTRRAAPYGEQSLQGVNLAVRKTAWDAVQSDLCHEYQHHEDLDLAAHMAHRRQKACFAPAMVVGSTARQAGSSLAIFSRYALSTPRTYRLHGLKTHRYMYPIVWGIIALYPFILMAYRGYDPITGKFSFKRLLSPAVVTGRVSPVSDVL